MVWTLQWTPRLVKTKQQWSALGECQALDSAHGKYIIKVTTVISLILTKPYEVGTVIVTF